MVETYPTWHPLVAVTSDRGTTITTPMNGRGYRGLDHTVYFANGFVTCPYTDGQEVINAVRELPSNPIATIGAERLDAKFYHPKTTAVLVRCEWEKGIIEDGMIPKSCAVPLLLERELPCWQWSKVGETWETMRPYFLGRPHGRRSSLFVNQETGQAMKSIWNAIINTGMFGPIKVDPAGWR